MSKLKTIINIPSDIKIIIWKKKWNNLNKIYLIHKTKQFKLIYSKNLIVDKWSNCLVLVKNHNNSEKLKIENKINFFLNSLNKFYFNKIKFKGKGFRIKFFKKIKLIKFYFGKSHKTFLILKKLKRKKINKYKFILFGINKMRIKSVSKVICNIRNINMYTLRGLRESRQIISKRKGKKGTYI